MRKYLVLLLVVTGLILTSCYKEGAPGPVGPQGENGLNGANGQNGQNGESPKVYYFDVQLKQFTSQGYNSSWITYSYVDGITITDNDLVMAYVNLSSDGNGDNYWQAMPHSEYVDNGDFFIQHSFGIMGINDDSGNNNYLAGNIMFSLRTNTGVAPYLNMNTTSLLKYNVYIIKGTIGKKAQIPTFVDVNNKIEVEAYVESLR